MTREQADKIYDILVELGGADKTMRANFIYHHLLGTIDEYRFEGEFGFGGRYWCKRNEVDYYLAHSNKELDELMDSINKKLSKIF